VGLQNLSGCDGEEKNNTSQTLPELKPPIIQPVAQCYTMSYPSLNTVSENIKLYVGSYIWF